MAQHKAIRRRALRSALAHKRAADAILDGVVSLQKGLNSTLAKLDADSAAALDTDYVSTQALGQLVDWDAPSSGHGHKQSLRDSIRSGLANRELADEVIDSITELQVAHDALLAKLDAEAGTLADTDYEATLAVEAYDQESRLQDSPGLATLKGWLSSALASKQLAEELGDALSAAQGAFNAALAVLDSGTINGAMPSAVSELKPDERL